jgi:DNA invertase Pin-like site-specific DNA recombinase
LQRVANQGELLTEATNQERFVGYFRVSTDKQGRSGLGLDAQQEAVSRFVQARSSKLISEIVEIESGTRADRPMLAEALRLCRVHRATLLIAKLDRLARNVAFISNLMESGVEFEAVDFPSANRLTIHILSAVAEHEAGMIRERTRSALAAAKKRGVKLGGDRGNLPSVALKGAQKSAEVRRARALARAEDLGPLIMDMREQGFSYRLIADELNARSIATTRGGAWGPSQVHRLIEIARSA